MAWTVIRNRALVVALVLSGAVNSLAQTSISAKGPDARIITQRDLRISSLLIQLADQARMSDDLAFAVRAQAQAATMLWATDLERARAIYRSAFKSLAASAASKPTDNADNSNSQSRPGASISRAEKQQLRSELLNQIAGRDPELAEELARSLAEGVENLKDSCADNSPAGNCEQMNHATAQSLIGAGVGAGQGDIERRELLISVALQVVERDPQRAMALGQLSIASGISQNFSRLLVLMRTVDPSLADLLFSCALARLEQSPSAQLSDIHTLGAYLVASVNSPAKQTLSRTEIVKFLHLALNQIVRRAEISSIKGATRPDESAAIYFIQRQLADLVARYLPDRNDQMMRRLSFINDDAARDQTIDLASMRPSPPLEIAREARDAADDNERDSLNARAALAWLGKGEIREAQVAALKIADTQMRDRVLSQVTRRYASEDRLEDAVAIARRIESEPARIDALVMLSGAAQAASDRARATELLNEAENFALKTRPAFARASALLKIVNSFCSFDPVRGFEVMQAAVKAINETSGSQEQNKQASKAASPNIEQASLDELLDSAFESTLAALARTDFERALLLAQQLDGKETSVAAQLAVCRGGLAHEPHREQAKAEAEEIGSGANHF